MRKQRKPIHLSEGECDELDIIARTGQHKARIMRRAQILLWSDAGKTDSEIARLLNVTSATVAKTRQRWIEKHQLEDTSRPGRGKKLDGKQEAFIVALACSDTPDGQERWTMQMLADKVVELGIVEDTVSDETIRRTLKKNELKPWLKEHWCIPTVGADFVWHMEDILDLYAEPYQAKHPSVCFDERPCQLLGDIYAPLPLQPGQARREDYEYERNGTANLFMMCQPLAGWREVKVTEHRKKGDFAECMRELVDIYFPDAEVIRVVLDNLNIHSPGSLYEAFPPPEARRILRKLEFHFTPKHASWLNMAEIELAILSRQCLKQRIADQEELAHETQSWTVQRNTQQAKIKWCFDVEQARTKLMRLYPDLSI